MSEGQQVETGTPRMLARRDGAIGWIIFNQPKKRNAVSIDMWAAVPGIVDAFLADPDIRVIVMKGAGDQAFIAGADISEFGEKRNSPEATQEYDAVAGRAYRSLIQAPLPVIAMINGFCIGGGLAVALCADIRIAADNARFAIPAARLGLGYGAEGARRLVEIVGPAFAKEIFFTARQFDAAEAQGMGLINRVTTVDGLEARVREDAGRIAANAPLTIRAAKLTVDTLVRDPVDRDMAAVDQAVMDCFASADFREGRTAFMEKRLPQFRGR